MTLGSTIVATRECEGWTQAEMARRLGISAQHLGQIEKGRKAVSVERAAAWSKVLSLSPVLLVSLALQEQVDEAGLRLTVHLNDKPEPTKRRRTPLPARKKARATA